MTAFAVHSYFRVGKISITAKVFSQALEMIMNIVIIWYGAHLVFDARLSMGALIAFQMISSRVSSPLVKMVSLVHEYQQVSLSVRMLGVVMNSKPEESGGNLRSEVRGDISFHDVSFQYRPDTLPVINDFTLHIRPGEILGIVGRSGSGKSTIAKLVQAMYTPQQGFLRMDGIDIRELDKMHLRRNIGVVLQENYFFHGTIPGRAGRTPRRRTLSKRPGWREPMSSSAASIPATTPFWKKMPSTFPAGRSSGSP